MIMTSRIFRTQGVKACCTFAASGCHSSEAAPNAILQKVNALMTPKRTMGAPPGNDGAAARSDTALEPRPLRPDAPQLRAILGFGDAVRSFKIFLQSILQGLSAVIDLA